MLTEIFVDQLSIIPDFFVSHTAYNYLPTQKSSDLIVKKSPNAKPICVNKTFNGIANTGLNFKNNISTMHVQSTNKSFTSQQHCACLKKVTVSLNHKLM